MLKKKIRKEYIIGIIVGIIIFFCSITYIYQDIIWTQRNSLDLLHLLFDGKVRSFYQYSEAKGFPAYYELTIYIIFAIWNIPCFIYERISGMNSQELVGFLLWGKMIVFVGYALFLYVFGKLCKCLLSDEMNSELWYDRHSVICYLIFSPLFLLYSLYTGNYDVISLIFIVSGVICLIKGKDKQFVLFFALASSIKYFALLLLVPIVLLREKRLPKLLLRVVECFSITIFEKLLLSQSSSSILGTFGFAVAFTKQGGKSPVFSLGEASMFLLCYCFLCLYCFLQEENDEQKYRQKLVYVITVVWAIITLFININSYWIVYIIPFITIVLFFDSKNKFINIFLEIVFNCSMFIFMLIDSPHIIRANTSVNLLGGLMEHIRGVDLSSSSFAIGDLLINIETVLGFGSFIIALAVGSLLAILFLNCPEEKVQRHINDIKYSDKVIDRLLIVRNILGICIFVSPVIYFCLYSLIY